MKVLNFGSCNIDKVHHVENICKSGETISSHKLEIFSGGKGLNQSIALSRAGTKIYHAGCIGKDGLFLKELLQNDGVNVEYLKCSGSVTGYAMIQVDNAGENCIVLFGGANLEITREFIDQVLSDFANGDFIVLQNEISNLKYIIDRAYERGLKIILNPSPFNNQLKGIDFNKITYLILNETEAQSFSDKKTESEFFEFVDSNYPNIHIVLTLGSKGSVYKFKDEYIYQPAYKVEAKDTTGAGDTFTGFFTAEIINGSSPKLAMKLASVASAIAVSRFGAATSIPTRVEVLDAVSKLKTNDYSLMDDEQLKLFKSMLKENYQDLTLKQVATRLNYSLAYTYKWVTAKTGNTFLENLQKQRLSVAEELLRTTNLSIGEIVFRVGYNNAGYFRKIFFKKFNMTPLQFRKKFFNKDLL